MLRSIRAILKLNLREALAYRADLLADLLSALILLAIYYFLWRAVFEVRPSIQGLDFEFMVGYIVLVRVVRGFSQTEVIEDKIASRVRDGAIAIDLLRPYSLQLYYYLQAYGHSLLGALLISLPIFILALVALDLPFSTPARLLLFLVSLQLGFAVNAALSFFVGLAALPLKNNEGVVQVKRFIISLLSGNLFPIVLLPGPLRAITELLPFRATVDIPVGIYLGNLPPTMLLFQGFWAVILGAAAHLLFLAARRRLVILGG
jgi:ABC-2 type transport system permease protein